MPNPWESIPLHDYEAHMSLAEVSQLQTLNRIVREQLTRYPARTLAVLGAAGGNGLEHIAATGVEAAYGIDINAEYLDACRKRLGDMGGRLRWLQMDISDLRQQLPVVELVIADLLVEYVGTAAFAAQIGHSLTLPGVVSCVIQQNSGEQFVSASPYLHSFDGISELHRDIEENELSQAMEGLGYRQDFRAEHPLPNGKRFIRLDYIK